eukprot:5298549-Pyramimonas_sp.AAC.1
MHAAKAKPHNIEGRPLPSTHLGPKHSTTKATKTNICRASRASNWMTLASGGNYCRASAPPPAVFGPS